MGDGHAGSGSGAQRKRQRQWHCSGRPAATPAVALAASASGGQCTCSIGDLSAARWWATAADELRWAGLVSDAEQVHRLRAAKDQFESLDSALFRQGRVATNPFERLGTGPFVCRSALKLVEMDALCGLATATAAAEPRPAASSEFTFVDVCGGPGGFSEFLCTKGRGWGITLKEAANDCDWKIDRVVTSAAYFLLNGCFLPLFHQKQVHFEGFWQKRAAI